MLASPAIRAASTASPTPTPLLSGFGRLPVANAAVRPLAIPLPQITQLIFHARTALSEVAPLRPTKERVFLLGGRRFVVLAANCPHGRRVPRSPELIRLALESGAGLQLRAIGLLAIVAIELPFASEIAL